MTFEETLKKLDAQLAKRCDEKRNIENADNPYAHEFELWDECWRERNELYTMLPKYKSTRQGISENRLYAIYEYLRHCVGVKLSDIYSNKERLNDFKKWRNTWGVIYHNSITLVLRNCNKATLEKLHKKYIKDLKRYAPRIKETNNICTTTEKPHELTWKICRCKYAWLITLDFDTKTEAPSRTKMDMITKTLHRKILRDKNLLAYSYDLSDNDTQAKLIRKSEHETKGPKPGQIMTLPWWECPRLYKGGN